MGNIKGREVTREGGRWLKRVLPLGRSGSLERVGHDMHCPLAAAENTEGRAVVTCPNKTIP